MFYKNGEQMKTGVFSISSFAEKDLYLVSTVGPGGVVLLRYSGSQQASTASLLSLASIGPLEKKGEQETQRLATTENGGGRDSARKVQAEVCAVWDVWETKTLDELIMKEGDVIEIYSRPQAQEVWYGRNKRTGQVGTFLRYYVSDLERK